MCRPGEAQPDEQRRVVDALTAAGFTVTITHESRPGNEPGQSSLTVTGEDISLVLDLIDFSGLPLRKERP
jgi:hypothetical protein